MDIDRHVPIRFCVHIAPATVAFIIPCQGVICSGFLNLLSPTGGLAYLIPDWLNI